MANSNTEALKELSSKTGELAVTIEKIALNSLHVEKTVLKEVEGLKDDIFNCRSDSFAGREKMELSLRDHNHRLTALELAAAKKVGEEGGKITVLNRHREFWNSNGMKFILLFILSVPLIAGIYNMLVGS